MYDEDFESDHEHPNIFQNTSIFVDKDEMLYFKREFEDEDSYLRLYKYNFVDKDEQEVKSFEDDHIQQKETDKLKYHNCFS